MHSLGLSDFCDLFGGAIDTKTLDEAAIFDWRYRIVEGTERDKIIMGLLKRVEQRDFSIAGENIQRWEKGWSENLEAFRASGDVEALMPKYIRPAKYLRLRSEFVEPADPMFEANWQKVFRAWFARRYLAGFDCIYEFGCGSGHNVAWLAKEFPDTCIFGFDWAKASTEIIRELSHRFDNVLPPRRFDFFEPTAVIFEPNSAVLTIGALEQTGLHWRPFLDFLLRTKPAACFHIEPILEWYDWDNLVDHTAIKIHEARGFWRGFVNEVPPIRKHRTRFGSLLLEGYSCLQWSPAASEQARIDALEGAP